MPYDFRSELTKNILFYSGRKLSSYNYSFSLQSDFPVMIDSVNLDASVRTSVSRTHDEDRTACQLQITFTGGEIFLSNITNCITLAKTITSSIITGFDINSLRPEVAF
ncbi:MAG: hypothetical protein II948_04555 [Synergistaceae bacterium]|nr:hypothetical protein [Synergistaceae bacterium]